MCPEVAPQVILVGVVLGWIIGLNKSSDMEGGRPVLAKICLLWSKQQPFPDRCRR